MESLIKKLEGPVVVLGGTGFIGGHLVSFLKKERRDVYFNTKHDSKEVIEEKKPKTIFNCAGQGVGIGQPTVKDFFDANFSFVEESLRHAFENGCSVFIQAGSAAEYGDALVGPKEEDRVLKPTSLYGASKAAASSLIWFYGKTLGKRVANLRFYNVYGAGDKPSRLASVLVREGREGRFPSFKNEHSCYDFVHVEDVCRAFVYAALGLKEEHYGESFNIGGDVRTLGEIAKYAKRVFKIGEEAQFDSRAPLEKWAAESHKAEQHLGFKSEISFLNGLKRLARGKD